MRTLAITAISFLALICSAQEVSMPRQPENIFHDLHGIRADYQLATESRFRRTRMGLGGTGDAHLTQAQFWKVREYCRDADRNDSIVGAMADRMCDNVVGEGLECEPQTPDPQLNKQIKDMFWYWGQDKAQCCSRRMYTFGMQQRLVLRAEFFDGDIFAIPVLDGRVQLVEGDRALTPSNTSLRVIHGILLGDMDQPEQAWFTKVRRRDVHIEAVGDVKKYDFYDDEGFAQVWHCFDPKRSSQTRGVPAIKAVFDYLSMLEDVNFAKLVQQQVVSCIGLFIERDSSFKGALDATLGPRSSETEEDGTTRELEKLRPGLVIKGRKGEKPHALTANVPNAEYFPHVRMILRIIGNAAGMPLSLVLLDTSDTTFHGYRGELNEARKGFKRARVRLASNFNSNVYRWKVRQWFRKGKLLPAAAKFALDGSLYYHKWIGEGWPYVDPEKDAQADVVAQDNMLESPRELQARKGRDFIDVRNETIEDNGGLIRAAIAEAQAIEKETKVTVTWRDVLSPRGKTDKPTGQPKEPKAETGQVPA